MKFFSLSLILLCCSLSTTHAQDSATFRRISDQILLKGECYEDLRVLSKNIGHRLSGSESAAKAVTWAAETLKKAGADTVWLQPVEVPHWVRGKESLKINWTGNQNFEAIPMLSLGNTVGTDGRDLEAEIITVNNFDEFHKLPREKVAGKIVFFNYHFPQELVNTFEGYGVAGPYRWLSPTYASS